MTDINECCWDEALDAIDEILDDVRITEEDCGSLDGITLPGTYPESINQPHYIREFSRRALGRYLSYAEDEQGMMLDLEKIKLLGPEECRFLDDNKARRIMVSSPISCRSRNGVCMRCYGHDPVSLEAPRIGARVGRAAAESLRRPVEGPLIDLLSYDIGECLPENVCAGTSGTVRFGQLHEGMSIYPRDDHFTDRPVPVLYLRDEEKSISRFTLTIEETGESHELTNGMEILVIDGEMVNRGEPLYRIRQTKIQSTSLPPDGMNYPAKLLEGYTPHPSAIYTPIEGEVSLREEGNIVVVEVSPIMGSSWKRFVEASERERLCVGDRDHVRAGDEIIRGYWNSQKRQEILGTLTTTSDVLFLLQRFFELHRIQIEDRHLELVLSRMFRWCEIISPGDTGVKCGHIMPMLEFHSLNERIFELGRASGVAHERIFGVSQVMALLRQLKKEQGAVVR